MVLSYPKFDVITTSINDTLKALSEVIIEGEIEDDGIFLSNFNGIEIQYMIRMIFKSTLGHLNIVPQCHIEIKIIYCIKELQP